jgi:hypothetical protein
MKNENNDHIAAALPLLPTTGPLPPVDVALEALVVVGEFCRLP